MLQCCLCCSVPEICLQEKLESHQNHVRQRERKNNKKKEKKEEKKEAMFEEKKKHSTRLKSVQ